MGQGQNSRIRDSPTVQMSLVLVSVYILFGALGGDFLNPVQPNSPALLFAQAQAGKDDLSAKEQEELTSWLFLNNTALQARRDGTKLLQQAELAIRERRSQLAGSMSGGEQQMLALGMALMTKPKWLLLDEPSTGLAPVIVGNVMRRLVDVNKRHPGL